MLGQGGTLLEMSAPVRESDRSKVVVVDVSDSGEPEEEVGDAEREHEDGDTP